MELIRSSVPSSIFLFLFLPVWGKTCLVRSQGRFFLTTRALFSRNFSQRSKYYSFFFDAKPGEWARNFLRGPRHANRIEIGCSYVFGVLVASFPLVVQKFYPSSFTILHGAHSLGNPIHWRKSIGLSCLSLYLLSTTFFTSSDHEMAFSQLNRSVKHAHKTYSACSVESVHASYK